MFETKTKDMVFNGVKLKVTYRDIGEYDCSVDRIEADGNILDLDLSNVFDEVYSKTLRDEYTTIEEHYKNLENKKYELVERRFDHFEKKFLSRIKALRDFGDVKKGDFGGRVEGEYNLSHEGDCWIEKGSVVTGLCRVFDNARLLPMSSLEGAIHACDDVVIKGEISGHYHFIGNLVIDEYFNYFHENMFRLIVGADSVFLSGVGFFTFSEILSFNMDNLPKYRNYKNKNYFKASEEEIEYFWKNYSDIIKSLVRNKIRRSNELTPNA